MSTLFVYGDVLKGESKTKESLEKTIRINEAKHNNSLMPNELAGAIIPIGELYSGQLKQNKAKASVEEFENFIPDFDYETKYLKHEKLSAALKIVKETNSAAIVSYEERYKENEASLSKAA